MMPEGLPGTPSEIIKRSTEPVRDLSDLPVIGSVFKKRVKKQIEAEETPAPEEQWPLRHVLEEKARHIRNRLKPYTKEQLARMSYPETRSEDLEWKQTTVDCVNSILKRLDTSPPTIDHETCDQILETALSIREVNNRNKHDYLLLAELCLAKKLPQLISTISVAAADNHFITPISDAVEQIYSELSNPDIENNYRMHLMAERERHWADLESSDRSAGRNILLRQVSKLVEEIESEIWRVPQFVEWFEHWIQECRAFQRFTDRDELVRSMDAGKQHISLVAHLIRGKNPEERRNLKIQELGENAQLIKTQVMPWCNLAPEIQAHIHELVSQAFLPATYQAFCDQIKSNPSTTFTLYLVGNQLVCFWTETRMPDGTVHIDWLTKNPKSIRGLSAKNCVCHGLNGKDYQNMTYTADAKPFVPSFDVLINQLNYVGIGVTAPNELETRHIKCQSSTHLFKTKNLNSEEDSILENLVWTDNSVETTLDFNGTEFKTLALDVSGKGNKDDWDTTLIEDFFARYPSYVITRSFRRGNTIKLVLEKN